MCFCKYYVMMCGHTPILQDEADLTAFRCSVWECRDCRHAARDSIEDWEMWATAGSLDRETTRDNVHQCFRCRTTFDFRCELDATLHLWANSPRLTLYRELKQEDVNEVVETIRAEKKLKFDEALAGLEAVGKLMDENSGLLRAMEKPLEKTKAQLFDMLETINEKKRQEREREGRERREKRRREEEQRREREEREEKERLEEKAIKQQMMKEMADKAKRERREKGAIS